MTEKRKSQKSSNQKTSKKCKIKIGQTVTESGHDEISENESKQNTNTVINMNKKKSKAQKSSNQETNKK